MVNLREHKKRAFLNSEPTRLKRVSVVVPMFNEEECVNGFFDALLPVLRETRHPFEVVCVDDGCTDGTIPLVRAWMQREPAITLVRLARNFGKERALVAAIDHATGDAVIPMDADLQDPPELIPELLEKWREGYDTVIARRDIRPGDSMLKRQSANWFYRIMNRFSEVSLPPNAGDFRLLDRRVVDALKQLPESTRFHKGLYAWVGFKTCEITFVRPERFDGQTKWNYWRLWNYALDGVFSFSNAPLKLWAYVGVITALSGFAYAALVMVKTLVGGADVPGYASLVILLLTLNGLTMIGIGVVGEYVGRVFTEVKRRPLYLTRSVERSIATLSSTTEAKSVSQIQ